MNVRLFIFVACATAAFFAPIFIQAQTESVAEVQREIDEHSLQIAELDKEIAQYQTELESVARERNTLQNALNQLDIQRRQLNATISRTQTQIDSTRLQIRRLEGGIEGLEQTIGVHESALGESLRRLDQAENRSFVLTILSSGSISEAWRDIDTIATLQGAVRDDIRVLSQEKTELAESKETAEEKQAELVTQQRNLLTQQQSLDSNRRAQSELVQQTRAQESEYQRIISERQAARASFEAALTDLQAQYQQILNPSQIPPTGKGILRWPFDNVRVTQYFGNTAFAASGAYSGNGHNGIDLGAPHGTPVKASLAGTVIATGNTDEIRGCYSFGRWIMIRHNNGLNTMYSHLSRTDVSNGQEVSTGQVIGLSGGTPGVFGSGYSTGPHLHFGVYVGSVTEIIPLRQATNRQSACANALMPVPRSLNGYLNPLNYL